jgi:hypothetical protein
MTAAWDTYSFSVQVNDLDGLESERVSGNRQLACGKVPHRPPKLLRQALLVEHGNAPHATRGLGTLVGIDEVRLPLAERFLVFRAEVIGKGLNFHFQTRNLASCGSQSVDKAVQLGVSYFLGLSPFIFFLEEFKTILNEV